MSNESAFVVVFVGHTVEADFLKSLLESEGIKVFLRNEAMGTIAPFYVEAAGAGAVKVVVQRDDLDIAAPIVREFVENSKE
jgi:hypothetical protein